MNIAIIPARGGSKRIPNKNIRLFNGIPILARTIKNALDTKIFSHVFVSTDSNSIASIAIEAGAQILGLRPEELSNDFATTISVIKYEINRIDFMNNLQNICCIYPCTPSLTPDDLISSFNVFKSVNLPFLYPVIKYSHPIQRAMTRSSLGKMKFISPDNEISRTQDHRDSYYDAGQYYWGTKESWINNSHIHSSGYGLISDSIKFVDIDNEDDWKRAEFIFNFNKSNITQPAGR